MKEIVFGIIIPAATRHAVGALGATGLAAGDDAATQIAGGFALLATLGFSIASKIRARRAKSGA